MQITEEPILKIYDNCQSDLEMIYKLEDLAHLRLKNPLKQSQELPNSYKINRNDSNNLEISKSIPTVTGVVKNINNQMTDVLKHDFLRKSIE